MSTKLRSACGLAVVVGALLSCAPTAAPPTPTLARPMKVPIYYWPGEYWVDVAHEKGWFREGGLDVEIVDTNPDFFASLDWIRDGRLDVQCYPVFDLIRACARGEDLVAVFCSDQSVGAEKIVARSGLRGMRDLKGKRVGLVPDTYLHYIFRVAAERSGLAESDVEIVPMAIAEHAVLVLKGGTVDAVVAWEPTATAAKDAVSGEIVFDTSSAPGLAAAVYAFKRSFIEEHPDQVRKFVAIWRKTTEYIARDGGDAYAITARKYGKTIAEVQAFAQINTPLNVRENLVAFSFSSGFDSLHGNTRQISDFLIRRGVIRAPVDSTTVLDSTFLRELR